MPAPVIYHTHTGIGQKCKYARYGHHLIPVPVMNHANTGTGPKCINANNGMVIIDCQYHLWNLPVLVLNQSAKNASTGTGAIEFQFR
jgi:hypothetical protein